MLDGEQTAAGPAGVDGAGRDRAEPARSRRQQGPGRHGAGHIPRHDLPQDPRIRDRRRQLTPWPAQVTAVLVQSRRYWFKVRTLLPGHRRMDAISTRTRGALAEREKPWPLLTQPPASTDLQLPSAGEGMHL